VAALAEPVGLIRDQLTIDAAQAAGVSLYFTGVRTSSTEPPLTSAAMAGSARVAFGPRDHAAP
jgi:hypothetical protein